MGGRDVSKDDIEEMFMRILDDSALDQQDRVQFIGMRVSTDAR